MADENKSKAAAWTDREKLAYIFGLIEASGIKLNSQDAPRPPGRTAVACKLMMNRLKGSVEKELEAWKNGEEYNEEAEKPKTTSEKPKATSGKRKAKDIENHEDSTPKKRAGGRKKKVVEDEHVGQGQGEIKQEFEIENDMI